MSYVELDLDDIRQVYRLKVWYALRKYDPARSRMPEERFVFCCLKNAEKDLLKKKRHGELAVEDLGDQSSVGEDEVFGDVFSEVLVPNTLTVPERHVVALLYAGYTQREGARRMGIQPSAMDRLVRSVRLKMSDWRPTGAGGTGSSPPAAAPSGRCPAFAGVTTAPALTPVGAS